MSANTTQSRPNDRAKREINPITGTYFPDPSSSSSKKMTELMTEEEKATEAEKLYVLFERMKRTGIISTATVDPTTGRPMDPEEMMRELQQSGRFEELDANDGAELETQEEEAQAEEEMRHYRQRVGRTR